MRQLVQRLQFRQRLRCSRQKIEPLQLFGWRNARPDPGPLMRLGLGSHLARILIGAAMCMPRENVSCSLPDMSVLGRQASEMAGGTTYNQPGAP
jgi:hypothetical protein